MRRPLPTTAEAFPLPTLFSLLSLSAVSFAARPSEPPVWIRSATINRNATISRIKLVFSSFSSERLFCSCNCTIWSFALLSLVSKYVISFKRFSEVSLSVLTCCSRDRTCFLTRPRPEIAPLQSPSRPPARSSRLSLPVVSPRLALEVILQASTF